MKSVTLPSLASLVGLAVSNPDVVVLVDEQAVRENGHPGGKARHHVPISIVLVERRDLRALAAPGSGRRNGRRST